MPVYEYACKSCAQHIDVRQSFSDPPLTVHEGCGGELRRVLQPVGIVFKGSGWYKTDSRSTPSESSSDSGSSAGASSAPAKSGDSTSSSSDSSSSSSSGSGSTPSSSAASTSTSKSD